MATTQASGPTAASKVYSGREPPTRPMTATRAVCFLRSLECSERRHGGARRSKRHPRVR
ncbi:hypothetical protein BKA80DRAFT_262038 [Phyllosticta citrichinensis]